MKRGFTIIEFMIIIAIVSILVAIAIPHCPAVKERKLREQQLQGEVPITETTKEIPVKEIPVKEEPAKVTEIRVYGYLEDRIKIEGAITEEYIFDKDNTPNYLMFSDGTILSIDYVSDDIWLIEKIVGGSAKYKRTTDSSSSDIVVLTGNIKWVSLSTDLVIVK